MIDTIVYFFYRSVYEMPVMISYNNAYWKQMQSPEGEICDET